MAKETEQPMEQREQTGTRSRSAESRRKWAKAKDGKLTKCEAYFYKEQRIIQEVT